MGQIYKILGQIYPGKDTLTNVYVSPASTNTVINTIYVCNQSVANANVDIIVRPVNESLSNNHYILKDQKVDQADTLILNLNLTLNEDVILAGNNSVRAGETTLANISISAFGVEVTED